jgi:hypothetical protein
VFAPLPLRRLHDAPESFDRQTLSGAKPRNETVTRLWSNASIAIRDTQRSGRPAPFWSTRVHVGEPDSPLVV